MASHRKPRTPVLSATGSRAAIGISTAALASVTLMGEAATAAPATPAKPSVEEVKDRVDSLYRQAEVATQKYNGAKEKTDSQREDVEKLLDELAEQTDAMNDARRKLGAYAAEQYRTGGLAPSTTFLLSPDPQAYFDQDHLMDRLGGEQDTAVKDFRDQQAAAFEQRREASEKLDDLTETQQQLGTQKKTVQKKLTEARELLADLTAEEKARLAAIERQKEREAAERAAELAEAEKAREAAQQEQSAGSGTSTGPGTSTGTGSTAPASSRAAEAVAFARAQIGKPYVWGASGPSSYDCSGLTQAAWKAAGVALPRTTWDQVEVGTRVSMSQLQPGDLVFFYNDISHVGLYAGGGMMIHAPKPGDLVKEAPITEMPFYAAVRPA
ncbi:NlpC/P60 family protein [Streptomyces sp. NPDC059506]|uniref:C40 family peptidase n=1 Tax=Streptomyces TaxID=1883 RepID=UPI000CC793BE|nr:C40 family peptidase [Streptomyces sp. SCUT-3]PLW72118.1 glycoside hydrolase [Streptomyces sp. DJ]QMV22104.1 glycoside hydrolase [Streptomyces sp. SCUT-3]